MVGDYQVISEACGTESTGKLYLLGFKINGGFVRQIEVCFDDARASAIYSRHSINGLAMKCEYQ